MKIGMSLWVLLLLTGIVVNAQVSPDLPPQPDPICQITNFAWEDVDVVHIYESPHFDSAVIGILKRNETVQSDGFIRIGDGVWFVVDHAEATGFIWNDDIWAPPNCPPATVPRLSVPMPEPLTYAPLLTYISNNEVHLWDGERSINISPSPGSRAEQPVWSHQGDLAWVGYPLNPIQLGTADIFIWDGWQTINLDRLLGLDLDPSSVLAWSVDGQLALSGGGPENAEIYVWDGEQIINISQNPAHDAMPAWSGDGRLAWTSERDGNTEIYVWDGEQIINISQNPGGNDSNATWSEDGRLAWGGIVNHNLEVLVWDGEQVINVSQDAGWDAWHAWSADGRLAWVSNRDDDFAVYVCDGEDTIRVSEPDTNAANLSWSPDGRLAWQSERDFHHDIHIWDGEQVVNFTQLSDTDAYSPRWNTDGWLAWVTDTGISWNIAVWDGEQIINVTDSMSTNRYHTWAPR
jgi:hypothetical protein